MFTLKTFLHGGVEVLYNLSLVGRFVCSITMISSDRGVMVSATVLGDPVMRVLVSWDRIQPDTTPSLIVEVSIV